MSKNIDLSKGVEKLSDADLFYLAQRDNAEALAELQRRGKSLDLSQGRTLEEYAHTGDANTRGETIEELEARLKRMKEEQGANSSGFESEDEEDDDEDVDYSSWSNDELRAELARRNLSVDGKKADLVARLEEDDASEEDDSESKGESEEE